MPFVPLQKDQNGNVVQESYGDRAFRGEYDGDGNLIYAGFALPGSDESDLLWQIKQLNYTDSNLDEILWPQFNGKASREYNFSWDDRASYTYS